MMSLVPDNVAISTTVPSIPAGKCISATATIKSSDGFAGDLFITFGANTDRLNNASPFSLTVQRLNLESCNIGAV
jgi:hypothetical protein